MELITVEQLSKKIHKAKASIYSDLIRNPNSLPPVFRIAGSRRVLFQDVDQWLNNINQSPPVLTTETEPAPLKRGRPTKSQQLTRDRRVSHASPTRGINTQ